MIAPTHAAMLAEALEQAKQWQIGMVLVRQPEGYNAVVPPGEVSTIFRTLLEACAAYQASQSEGEGAEFVLVPREPSHKVLLDIDELSVAAQYSEEGCREVYRAMLQDAAAPVPPAQPPASQWRTMESAPRDGTKVVLAEYDYSGARWWFWVDHWRKYREPYGGEGWGHPARPTHWTSPPDTAQGEG